MIVLENAHDCATNTPDPRPLRLVSRRFQELVLATPILWHHIVRRVSYFNPGSITQRIKFSGGIPLILSLEISHGDELDQFAPIFRQHRARWRVIEIHGCSFEPLIPALYACELASLNTLSILPCRYLQHDNPSRGLGLSVIRAPLLRCLRMHLVQLDLVLTERLERLHVDCLLPPDYAPISLSPAFLFGALTHLMLSNLRQENQLPDTGTTLPSLSTLILYDAYAQSVRPLLVALRAPQLRTLAVSISISSPFTSADIASHVSVIAGYPQLRLVHLHQSNPQQYPRASARLLYSLGWAFPSVQILQTNMSWGLLATALNPTPADVPFSGLVRSTIPVPFPRIHTLALREGRPSSLITLAQCFTVRVGTLHPIINCAVESHLLQTVRSRIPEQVETIEWDRDFDADQQPLFPLF